MEIKTIKSISSSNNRGENVAGIINNLDKKLDTSVTQFVDGTPTLCNYYAIDKELSTTGVGFNDNAGAYSGAVKYKLIKNFTIYGYEDEKTVDKERVEVLDDVGKMEMISSLILPNTVIPVEGDRLTLAIENHSLLYKVVSVNLGTFTNKPYYKIEFAIDTELPAPDFKVSDLDRLKLITKKFIFHFDNIGTDLSCFLEEDEYKNLIKLQNLRKDLNDEYADFFYNELSNTFLCEMDEEKKDDEEDDGIFGGKFSYFVPLVDLQMEYFPLKVYGTVDAILHHETVNKKKTLMNWKKSNIRRFINRKNNKLLEEGLKVYPYTYIPDINYVRYNIGSYFNNRSFSYVIYDYDQVRENQPPTILRIPEDMKDVFTKYSEDNLKIKEVIEVLENIELDFTREYLIFTPILLVLIDIFIYNLLYVNDHERFY